MKTLIKNELFQQQLISKVISHTENRTTRGNVYSLTERGWNLAKNLYMVIKEAL